MRRLRAEDLSRASRGAAGRGRRQAARAAPARRRPGPEPGGRRGSAALALTALLGGGCATERDPSTAEAVESSSPLERDPGGAGGGCVVFVGDVGLSRGVAASSPEDLWGLLPPTGGDAWIGNLEGAVAPEGARCEDAICLGIEAGALSSLAARPFRAMSMANNHSLDFGAAGLQATAAGLEALGIAALTAEGAPRLLTIEGLEWAIVPVDLSEGDVQGALERARRQLALARAQTPRVVAFAHWGWEGQPELTPLQIEAASLMRTWGAAIVVGAGAHVVQPADCEAGAWYGLGNFLFDQRWALEGAALRCCPVAGGAPGEASPGSPAEGLRCQLLPTRRTRASVAPTLGAPGPTCEVRLGPSADPRWALHPASGELLSVHPLRSAGEGAFFALHRRWSEFDQEDGIRPYVFEIREDQSMRALWRGTALSWPLIAAKPIEVEGRELLCALHRGDSFLALDPSTEARRYAVYRWVGLEGGGFRTVDDPAAQAACEAL